MWWVYSMSKLQRNLKFLLILNILVSSILLAGLGTGYFATNFIISNTTTMAPSYDVNITNTTADTKLILVSYMRSGSSFVGELFNQHSRVFFMYEPFWSLDVFFQRPSAESLESDMSLHPALFFHQPMMIMERRVSSQQIALLKRNVMESVINCDFESMYLGPLLVRDIYITSNKFKPFDRCTTQNPGVLGLLHCLPELLKACRSASVIATKVVRITMKEVETYLQSDPKVKVIHLVRDPRAVISSRKKSLLDRVYRQSNKAFCKAITEDVQLLSAAIAFDVQRSLLATHRCLPEEKAYKTSVLLKKMYPGRVMTARYEDVAEQPLDFAALLLSFAGLKMEPALRKFVWKITSSNKNNIEDMWGTYRADSKRTAGLWRASASFEFVSSVDRDCRELQELMGYAHFDNETTLRNMKMTYYKDYTQVHGLWETTVL